MVCCKRDTVGVGELIWKNNLCVTPEYMHDLCMIKITPTKNTTDTCITCHGSGNFRGGVWVGYIKCRDCKGTGYKKIGVYYE